MNKLQELSSQLTIITQFIFKLALFGLSLISLAIIFFIFGIIMFADKTLDININTDPQVTEQQSVTPAPTPNKSNLM